MTTARRKSTPTPQDLLREEILRQTKEFLKKGGQIEVRACEVSSVNYTGGYSHYSHRGKNATDYTARVKKKKGHLDPTGIDAELQHDTEDYEPIEGDE